MRNTKLELFAFAYVSLAIQQKLKDLKQQPQT